MVPSYPRAEKFAVRLQNAIMSKYRIETEGLTDVGQKRDHNEDSILFSRELGLFAVADGMGGHAAGEVASNRAIDEIGEFVRRVERDSAFLNDLTTQEGLNQGERILCAAIANANRQLCSMAEENSSYCGMGTTIAALYIQDDAAHIGHVGDSRVYRIRNGKMDMMTQDHSWVNEQLQKKVLTEEEARSHRWRNVITRALGNRPDVEIDFKTVMTRAGDVFLICSDGLTSMVEDERIAQCVAENVSDLQRGCRELVRMANEAGGHDNVSVILVRIERSSDSTTHGRKKNPLMEEHEGAAERQ